MNVGTNAAQAAVNDGTSQKALCAEALQCLVSGHKYGARTSSSWVCGACGEPFQLPWSLLDAVHPRCGVDDCRGHLIPDPAGNTLDDLT